MTHRVESLILFYRTKGFGARDNRLVQENLARSIYVELTSAERMQLAQAAVSGADKDLEPALLCLACYFPGSLVPFHKEFVQRRKLHPGVLFHGADSTIANEIFNLIDRENEVIGTVTTNHALTELAWIGDDAVQSAFATWRDKPPLWASTLFVPPHAYAHEAGWELTADGRRRDLYHKTAFPLIRSSEGDDDDSPRIGIEHPTLCPWCERRLTVLFDIDDMTVFIPEWHVHCVSVLACDVCSCYGTVFGKIEEGSRPTWHEANEMPDFLSTGCPVWEPFPNRPLVTSGKTRHFLAAANWLTYPSVPASQIGGIPTSLQDAEYPQCPDCQQTMSFVGQISNEDFMEYAEGIYYAFLCTGCGITATNYQQS